MAKNKDWTGNKKSVFAPLGASNHTDEEREIYDFYATDPVVAEWLHKLETLDNNIWECACGQGHLSKVFERHGYTVRSSDFVDRGYGEVGKDFLGIDNQEWHGDIVTNPPFAYAKDFILKGLQIIPHGNKVCMFLKLQFMESDDRKHLFVDFPPKVIYVSCSRIMCAKNADFAGVKKSGSAVAYAWYVWEKGYKGDTVLKWFN